MASTDEIAGIIIYVFGTLIHGLAGLPAPVAMLFLAVWSNCFL
jgi:hypothetical protein